MGAQALLTSHSATSLTHVCAVHSSRAFSNEGGAQAYQWTPLPAGATRRAICSQDSAFPGRYQNEYAIAGRGCSGGYLVGAQRCGQARRARNRRVFCSTTSAAWSNGSDNETSVEQVVHASDDPAKARVTVTDFSGSGEELGSLGRGQNGAESSSADSDSAEFKTEPFLSSIAGGLSNETAASNSGGLTGQNVAASSGVEAQALEADVSNEKEAGEAEEAGRQRFFLIAFFVAVWQAMKNNGLVKIVTQWPAWQQKKRLERMEAIADGNPKDSAKQAEYYSELNKVSPQAVIERFERREHATNAQVVVEYLRALVATNAISEYLPDERTGRISGLQALLQELKQRSSGDATEALPPPGLTEQQPLHVLMVDSKPKGGNTQWGIILKEVLQSTLVCIILFLLWMMVSAWLRKYVNGVTGGVGAAPGGMAGASAAYAPKEYSKEILPEKNVKTFKDVRGCDEAKAELEEIVQYLKDPTKFTRLGGKLPKGVLLIGPPGTGKTLLAKAIAGEAGVPFYYRAGSEFEEMFVGVGARRVRSLFQVAKKKAPCIVFIDEIDAVGGSRKQWEGHTKKTLNQLLVEMDGFEANEGIIVLAATNLPETLDPALTRPGRFDRHVVVPNPDVRGRQEILELYLQDKPLSPDIDIKTLARGTPGFSGADLANLVNEAAVKAAKDNRERIETEHLEYAKDKILMGTERKSMFLSEESRRMTAYHESGHAVVALKTEGAHPIHKATITPRGDALGMVTQLPDKDETSRSMLQMLASLDVCMGGRVAEEMVFGPIHVTSGARSDLQQATSLARHMVCECGMSDEVGPVFVDTSSSTLSPSIRKTVDDEVVRLLKEAYERVKRLLKTHEKELHRLAQELIDKETLTAKDITEVLAPLAEGGGLNLAGGLGDTGIAIHGR